MNFLIDSEFLPYFIKLVPVIFSFAGVFLALFIYTNKLNLFNILINYQYNHKYIRQLHFFVMKKWYFDILYNRYIATNIYALGSFLYKNGDQGLLEFVGPQGLYTFLSFFILKKNYNSTIYYNIILCNVTVLIVLVFLSNLF
jgi:NADH:ubiquinone oxidoreductase subunit 5 (subunit L)/multisubunit Na+/H+ antiporter MnhA subunit